MTGPENQRPQIEYPCQWGFKIIGNDEQSVREGIRECLRECLEPEQPERPVQIGGGRTSSGGKYVSVSLSLEVRDEQERNTLFRALADRPEVKMVI